LYTNHVLSNELASERSIDFPTDIEEREGSEGIEYRA
jgi:hypothetical protein